MKKINILIISKHKSVGRTFEIIKIMGFWGIYKFIIPLSSECVIIINKNGGTICLVYLMEKFEQFRRFVNLLTN